MLTEREFNRLKRQLWAEYYKKLSALHILAGKDAPQVSETSAVASPEKTIPTNDLLDELSGGNQVNDGTYQHGSALGTLINTVKLVVDKMPSNFTMKDVYHVLISAYPAYGNRGHLKPTISHYLKRLSNRGVIRIVQKGSGKAPTIYDRA